MPRVSRKRLSGSTTLVAGAFAAALVVGPCAMAEEARPETAKPAVSGINGKIDVTAGAVDSYNTTLYSGSVSAPLGHSFGAQLDFTGGEFSASRVLGMGGHLFWRDPDIGLAGIVASRSGFGDIWGSRYGAEAEAYLGPLTLALTGGWQNGERSVFIHTPWYGADLRYYPMDDLMLEVGGSHYAKLNAGHLGFEWRPGFLDALPGATLFADTAIGNKGYDHSLAGVRIYFGGGDKPLIRRHREDDPLGMLVGGVAGSGSSAAFGGSSSGTTSGGGSSGAGSSGGGGGGF